MLGMHSDDIHAGAQRQSWVARNRDALVITALGIVISTALGMCHAQVATAGREMAALLAARVGWPVAVVLAFGALAFFAGVAAGRRSATKPRRYWPPASS